MKTPRQSFVRRHQLTFSFGVKGGLREHVGSAVGVPQIAIDPAARVRPSMRS